MNIICLIWYHGTLAYLVTQTLLFPQPWPLVVTHLISLLLSILVQYLNVKNHYLAARLLLIGFSIIHCSIYSAYTNPGQLQELIMVTFPLVAIVLFDRIRDHLLVLFTSFSLAIYIHYIHLGSPFLHSVLTIFVILFISPYVILLYLKRLNQEKAEALKTERNKALASEQTIKAQAEQLKELNELKSKFFANVSHEIRTPLTLISGYANKLATQSSAEKLQQHAETIVDKSLDISELVDSVINYSKSDAKLQIDGQNEVNLSHLLNRIFDDFQVVFSQKDIQFSIRVPDRQVLVHCDRVLMKRAITNLMTNALKFTGAKGQVMLSLVAKDQLQFEVYNTGIGIPEHDLPKVFDRYYQSDNDITRSKGSGIGLSVTQDIVEAHGFKISVESEYNEFARFIIEIPGDRFRLSEINPVLSKAVRSQQRKHQKTPSLSSSQKTILLVEDNLEMREFIKSIEAFSHFNIVEANDGSEALLLLESHHIDIVITDYMMPRMNGLELVQQIKTKQYQIPVLVITAQAEQQRKLDMLRLGIDGYLNKPFLIDELSWMVSKALENDTKRKAFVEEQSENSDDLLDPDEIEGLNKRLKQVIDQNLHDRDFGVPELCETLQITERTLYRRVKELCGCTPSKLVTERRLLQARYHYDKGTYKTTRQLAMAVGFSNSTRFAKKFHDRFGIGI